MCVKDMHVLCLTGTAQHINNVQQSSSCVLYASRTKKRTHIDVENCLQATKWVIKSQSERQSSVERRGRSIK